MIETLRYAKGKPKEYSCSGEKEVKLYEIT